MIMKLEKMRNINNCRKMESFLIFSKKLLFALKDLNSDIFVKEKNYK